MFTRSDSLESNVKTGTRGIKILVLIFLNMLMSKGSRAQSPVDTAQGGAQDLRSAIEKVMRKDGVPGAAIAVVTKSGPTWAAYLALLNGSPKSSDITRKSSEIVC